ncbi:MAG: PDZ domain-containing protein [Acidobacteriota bacterium]
MNTSAMRRVLLCAVLLWSVALRAQNTSVEVPSAVPPIVTSAAHNQPLALEAGKYKGVRILTVGSMFRKVSLLQDFTAEVLALMPGDVIIAMDGQRTDGAEKLNAIFNARTTGLNVNVEFVRNGALHYVSGPVIRSAGLLKGNVPRWGATMEPAEVELTTETLHQPLKRWVMAVKIASIRDNTAAATAGLQKDDLLLNVNGRHTGQVRRSDILIPRFPVGTPLRFSVLRDGKPLTLSAPLTIVRHGLTKSPDFGFSGESQMVELPAESDFDLREDMA